jgi:hypothetical protein
MVIFHNAEIKWILPEIKTCFQGEISECKNKMDFFRKKWFQGKISECRNKTKFSKIKTWFQGEISECKNKIKYSKN